MKNLAPITFNLILINVVCYLAQLVLGRFGVDLADLCGLHFVLASSFHWWQGVSYMFLHGSFSHLFFNMFSLFMFGTVIERTLGAKRFLAYYFITGLGAAFCQELMQLGQYYFSGMAAYEMVNAGGTLIPMGQYLNLWTTIGASGACYGVLLAFGMLYPNERLFLFFLPIPIRAKYFVAGYAAIELWSAWASNDNVAHFAHLGGMIFGFLLLRYWRRRAQHPSRRADWSIGGVSPSRDDGVRSAGKALSGLFGRRRPTSAGNAHHTATRTTDYEENIRAAEDERRMDDLLAKVRRGGYDSLTASEKQELFQLSRRGK